MDGWRSKWKRGEREEESGGQWGNQRDTEAAREGGEPNRLTPAASPLRPPICPGSFAYPLVSLSTLAAAIGHLFLGLFSLPLPIRHLLVHSATRSMFNSSYY